MFYTIPKSFPNFLSIPKKEGKEDENKRDIRIFSTNNTGDQSKLVDPLGTFRDLTSRLQGNRQRRSCRWWWNEYKLNRVRPRRFSQTSSVEVIRPTEILPFSKCRMERVTRLVKQFPDNHYIQDLIGRSCGLCVNLLDSLWKIYEYLFTDSGSGSN